MAEGCPLGAPVLAVLGLRNDLAAAAAAAAAAEGFRGEGGTLLFPGTVICPGVGVVEPE